MTPHQADTQAGSIRPVGRPSSLDEAARGKLLLALAAGLTRREAGIWVGCPHATISYLLRHDEEFLDELRHYTRLARLHPHLCVYQMAGKSWQAAACLLEHLERRHSPLSTDRLLDAMQQMVRRVCQAERG